MCRISYLQMDAYRLDPMFRDRVCEARSIRSEEGALSFALASDAVGLVVCPRLLQRLWTLRLSHSRARFEGLDVRRWLASYAGAAW